MAPQEEAWGEWGGLRGGALLAAKFNENFGGKFEHVYVDKSFLKINNIIFDLDYNNFFFPFPRSPYSSVKKPSLLPITDPSSQGSFQKNKKKTPKKANQSNIFPVRVNGPI